MFYTIMESVTVSRPFGFPPFTEGPLFTNGRKMRKHMSEKKNLWTSFAEKHPSAAKWIREGGLFVIVSNVITVFKYLILQFLPKMLTSLPSRIHLAALGCFSAKLVQKFFFSLMPVSLPLSDSAWAGGRNDGSICRSPGRSVR